MPKRLKNVKLLLWSLYHAWRQAFSVSLGSGDTRALTLSEIAMLGDLSVLDDLKFLYLPCLPASSSRRYNTIQFEHDNSAGQ